MPAVEVHWYLHHSICCWRHTRPGWLVICRQRWCFVLWERKSIHLQNWEHNENKWSRIIIGSTWKCFHCCWQISSKCLDYKSFNINWPKKLARNIICVQCVIKALLPPPPLSLLMFFWFTTAVINLTTLLKNHYV